MADYDLASLGGRQRPDWLLLDFNRPFKRAADTWEQGVLAIWT